MHKEKEDAGGGGVSGGPGNLVHHEPHFRNRDLTTAYDHSLLDGDMFLQVSE
jgi:hypothetical protein